jgi:protein involved in polysaccharide export with SLBB domain
LDTLLVKQDKRADVRLQVDDQVYVFSKSSIDPLNVVTVTGQVVNPGQYPYSEKMHLVDLLLAAGGPNEQSYLKVAELTRYEVIDGKRRQSNHIEVNLADALAGIADANIVLLPHDELLIKTISNWRSTTRVSVQGEVKYPATYSTSEGERLSDVLVRAGGYTDEAYLRAAVFTRESVRADQQKQIEELAKRTEADVAKMEESVGVLKDEMLRTRQLGKLEAAKRISEQMKSVRATGRIVIELADIEKLKGSAFDLALRDGDSLYVPERPDEVQVLGEVYNQTAFVYQNSINGAGYLAMAGGPTRSGDASRTYVVRANGMLDVVNKSWFGGNSITIEPGDAIVVPQEVEQFNLVDSTLDWSRVMMQVGVSLASMKTIGIFK